MAASSPSAFANPRRQESFRRSIIRRGEILQLFLNQALGENVELRQKILQRNIQANLNGYRRSPSRNVPRSSNVPMKPRVLAGFHG